MNQVRFRDQIRLNKKENRTVIAKLAISDGNIVVASTVVISAEGVSSRTVNVDSVENNVRSICKKFLRIFWYDKILLFSYLI